MLHVPHQRLGVLNRIQGIIVFWLPLLNELDQSRMGVGVGLLAGAIFKASNLNQQSLQLSLVSPKEVRSVRTSAAREDPNRGPVTQPCGLGFCSVCCC